MKIRLTAVQPRSYAGDQETRDVEEALRWLDRAADDGAELGILQDEEERIEFAKRCRTISDLLRWRRSESFEALSAAGRRAELR